MSSCGLEAYFDGHDVHCEVNVSACADSATARTTIVSILEQAATGEYWAGRWKTFDLDERWHVLRVDVSESGGAGIGGGPLNASEAFLTPKRRLVAAALVHLADKRPDI